MNLVRRVQARFWQHSQLLRKPLRTVLRSLSLLRHRWRSSHQRGVPPRIAVRQVDRDSSLAISDPAIVVTATAGLQPQELERFLSAQTETSMTLAVAGTDTSAQLFLQLAPGCAGSPSNLVESLLLTAAVEDLDWMAAATSKPARHADSRLDHSVMLTRRPRSGKHRIVGRLHPRWGHEQSATESTCPPGLLRSGPYILVSDRPPAVIRHQVQSAAKVLRGLPVEAGPRTVLFLVPYLAVGGAERLLLDLLIGLADRFRTIVVSLDPHQPALGQQISAAMRITPHVYPLGDWLPREATFDALRHLLRRYQVETLVSWNATIDFYDRVGELHSEFPRLRILNQIYNHRGGWMERFTPSLLEAVDLHLAINRPIAEALVAARGVSPDRVALVEHGVAIPPQLEAEEKTRRRTEIRRQLGIPQDTIVVGSFLRLHRQKRPQDILDLAQRLAGRGVYFLMVGGGPLDGEIDRRLRRSPLPNLIRLPLRTEIEPLFDALDICLLTSGFEGLPVFLLEGLARQIPCVATQVGDIPDLLAEGGGSIAGLGDLDALENAIIDLLDPRLRQREGARGRRTIESRFGLDSYCQRYERCIFPNAQQRGPVPQ